jgi:hypothetical protein
MRLFLSEITDGQVNNSALYIIISVTSKHGIYVENSTNKEVKLRRTSRYTEREGRVGENELPGKKLSLGWSLSPTRLQLGFVLITKTTAIIRVP